MEVIIDGIVYVPKKKSELDLLKEKYENGSYICIGSRVGSIDKISELDWPKWHADWKYKLIHKKHRNILDAWLTDNSVEIEYEYSPNGEKNWWLETNFIDEYNEHNKYRLKQQYPIFKRNEDGEMFKITNDKLYSIVLSKNSENIGEVIYYCNSLLNSYETIPFDEERGFYHLQPVWCWDDGHNSKVTMFYDVESVMAIGFSAEKGNEYHWDNIEPITPEQLKVMPFVWKMYQQVLKDNK